MMNFNNNDADVMDQVHTILSGFIEIVPDEGDYTQDGILYCGKCRTPRQMETPGDEKKRLIGVECKCRQEENDRRRQQAEAENKKRRVEALRLSGMDEEAYRNMRFDRDDGHNPDITQLCNQYAKNFSIARGENLGLLFMGSVGSGKTFYACCIANALVDHEYKVVVSSFSRLAADIQHDFGKNRAAVLSRIKECDLLVLDDMGTERHTDYSLEALFEIVNARILAEKPMIITTNLTAKQLNSTTDIKLKRIYDRLKYCHPVVITGPSRRDFEAKKADKILRDIMKA